jgi:hypothetical protein
VRKRRRQKGKRERGEGECFGGNKRECEEKEEMVSERERECKKIERRLTAKKEEVVV